LEVSKDGKTPLNMLYARFSVSAEKDAFVLKLIETNRQDEVGRFLSEVNNVPIPWQHTTDQRYKEILQEEVIKRWKAGKENVTECDRPDW